MLCLCGRLHSSHSSSTFTRCFASSWPLLPRPHSAMAAPIFVWHLQQNPLQPARQATDVLLTQEEPRASDDESSRDTDLIVRLVILDYLTSTPATNVSSARRSVYLIPW